MQNCFTNATVLWDEDEIILRESLVNRIPNMLKSVWYGMNPAIQVRRVETPILIPGEYIKGHIETGFDLIDTKRGFLRPETTAGTIEAFHKMFPMEAQMRKRLPFCVWQVGKSFRDESKPDTMRASKLRLVEFHQMEFQLFVSEGTKADYIGAALKKLTETFGGEAIEAKDLPHYSRRTVDWEMDGLEVAGCSIRTDWEYGEIHEVAIGLDRLVAMLKK